MTSSFPREVDENCALVGYYAASSCNSLTTFRDTIGPILKGQESLRTKIDEIKTE